MMIKNQRKHQLQLSTHSLLAVYQLKVCCKSNSREITYSVLEGTCHLMSSLSSINRQKAEIKRLGNPPEGLNPRFV